MDLFIQETPTIPTVLRFPSQEIEALWKKKKRGPRPLVSPSPIGEGNRPSPESPPAPRQTYISIKSPSLRLRTHPIERCSVFACAREGVGSDPSCRRDPTRVSRHAAAEAPREGAVGERDLQWRCCGAAAEAPWEGHGFVEREGRRRRHEPEWRYTSGEFLELDRVHWVPA